MTDPETTIPANTGRTPHGPIDLAPLAPLTPARTVRGEPCSACPYRRDAPAGLWAPDEYDKLRAYDRPTHAQPMAGFRCHATPEHYCHGWAVVHSERGHAYELLALRMFPAEVPIGGTTPLWGSGAEAADHGQQPHGPDALTAADRLLRKYPRLRGDDA